MKNTLFLYFCGGVALFLAALSPVQSTVLLDGPEAQLTTHDLKNIFLTLRAEERQHLLENPDQLRQAIDSTYYTLVAAQRAERKGLGINDQELQARLWHLKINYLARQEIETLYADIDPAGLEQAALEKYEIEPERHLQPPAIFIAQLLIQQASDGADLSAAVAQAEAIKKRIKEGELTFSEAVQRYSQDEESKAQHGIAGWFTPEDLPEPLATTLFAMQSGDIAPVESEFGVHLVTIIERKEATRLPFEQVRDQLVEELRREARKQRYESYMLKIRDDKNTFFHEETLKAFLESYTPSEKEE